MIRVVLPAHLRKLARVDGEVTLAVAGQVTVGTILDALETRSTDQREAELLCPPGALIVRTSLIYGGIGEDRISPQERMVLEVADGARDMAFFTDEVRCPIEVGDLAAAVLELAALDAAGPLHVAGADVLSRLDFARLVCLHHGRDPALLRGEPGGPERPKHIVLDCSRARALLRVRLRGAREVLGA